MCLNGVVPSSLPTPTAWLRKPETAALHAQRPWKPQPSVAAVTPASPATVVLSSEDLTVPQSRRRWMECAPLQKRLFTQEM